MARSQRYKSVSVRLQHSVRGSFVTPLCRVERIEGLVLARRRRPSLGRQEICAVGKDSMTIWRQCAVMCWCLLTGIGSLRRSVTVPSRRLGGSASPLRRPDSGGAPIRIADSDPSGLFDALVPSIFQDMAERFPVISTDIYKSCQRKQERVGPLCLEPRRPNLRLSVDRGDGEVVSRTCRRQMTQGCIFATKMSSLVTESRRVFLARLKQLRRNENGGRHEMCYFGVALMLASPDHDDPPASTAQAARPPPVVKGRHRQRHSVALPWLAGVRHSSAVGADHKPTARSHSWDAKENLCRSLWLMSIVGWESCEKISGKRLFWELPRLGGRETEKHRFAAYSHLPLTACTSCFFGKGRIRRSMEFGRKGAMEFAPVQTDVPSMRPLGASHFCKPSSPDRNCKDKKKKEEINGNRNRRTMPELLPTPRVGGRSPCSAQPPNAGRTAAGIAFSSARSRPGPPTRRHSAPWKKKGGGFGSASDHH